jgi:hypothetical protein
MQKELFFFILESDQFCKLNNSYGGQSYGRDLSITQTCSNVSCQVKEVYKTTSSTLAKIIPKKIRVVRSIFGGYRVAMGSPIQSGY